jgi:phage gp29-like protein
MQKNVLTQELVSRVRQYSFMKYIGLLPNPDKVLSYAGRSYETLRDLMNDPHVWSCVQSRKSGITNCKWEISTNDKIGQDIKTIFEKIDLSSLISSIFNAILFGFQPIEIIWKLDNTGELSIVPDRFVPLPQEYFGFSPNGKLLLKGNSLNEFVELPEGKMICPQYEATLQNPYGTALLSKCYWACTFKNGAFRFWMNFMERYGMPLLIGQYQRYATTQEVEALADSLVNMAENSVIVAPEGIDIKIAEASRTSSVELYYQLVRTCNAEISKALLSQTLTTELDSGSYAASRTHYSIRREVIMSDLQFVQNYLQKVIDLIYKVNSIENIGTKFNFLPDYSFDE